MKTELQAEWLTHPISCTCEVMVGNKPLRPSHSPIVEFCDKPTVAAYPAMGGGWMALCARHARKHLPNGAYLTDELIAKGARWK